MLTRERITKLYWENAGKDEPVKLVMATIESNLLVTLLGLDYYTDLLAKGLLKETPLELNISVKRATKPCR